MKDDSHMAASLPDTYADPIHIAVIGGTGLRSLPGFTHVATLNPSTPWGPPSSPIHIHTHDAVPIAFLARHGPQHSYAPHEIPSRANIAALRCLGVRCIIAFSAVGSLREAIRPEDFVLPDQIIDRTKGIRPFTFFEGGVVGHVPFAEPFDGKLHRVVAGVGRDALRAASRTVHDAGTLVCIEGPQFSSRAESHLYRSWGCDVVNMSCLPEAKLALEAEIAYVMVCMATDYDCWRDDTAATAAGGAAPSDHVTVETVFKHMANNATNAKVLLAHILDELSRDAHADLVQAKHLEGTARGFVEAGLVTQVDAQGREARAKLRWLFGLEKSWT